jgi:hypothetical protein
MGGGGRRLDTIRTLVVEALVMGLSLSVSSSGNKNISPSLSLFVIG